MKNYFVNNKKSQFIMNNKLINFEFLVESNPIDIPRNGLIYSLENNNNANEIIYPEESASVIRSFSDFTIIGRAKIINNSAYNLIFTSTGFQIGSSPGRSTDDIRIVETSDNGLTTFLSNDYTKKITNDPLANCSNLIVAVTYTSETKTFKTYLSNQEGSSYTCNSIKTPYISNDTIIKTTGQCNTESLYLYNRVLSTDELTTIYNKLVIDADFYGQIIVHDIPTEIKEGESSVMYVSLSSPITNNQTININMKQKNVLVSPCNITFTPDDYNVKKPILITAIKESTICNDLTSIITCIDKNRKDWFVRETTNNILNKNIHQYPFDETIENRIKAKYPQCINFKGSFDWNKLDNNFWNDKVEGDFWINNLVLTDKTIHKYVFGPNDVIYYDGTYISPLSFQHYIKVPEDNNHYDICIVGGGAGGIGCAYALKDLGYKVCLVEKLDVLGGTHCNASIPTLISNPITGTWFKDICKESYDNGSLKISPYGTPEGLGDSSDTFEKLWIGNSVCYKQQRGTQIIISPSYSNIKYKQDLQDKIDIFLRTEFISSTFDIDNNIKSINVKNLDTKTTHTINANYFVDCSADGVLCRYGKELDIDFYIGSDSKARFNESAYVDGFEGDHYDINTVEGGYQTAGFSGAAWGDKPRVVDESFISQTYSDVGVGSNGAANDPWGGYLAVSTSGKCKIDPQIFIDEGNDIALEKVIPKSKYHWYINNGKNFSSASQYARNNKMLGIRESYRINCERMLTETDCTIKCTSSYITTDHIIALSTWYADIHNSQIGVSIKGSWLNGLPYESMIPCSFKNVLVASRCFGCSHLAQSSFRLTKAMMSLGYAAGNALKQCVDNSIIDVRDIDILKLQDDIKIHELLENTVFAQKKLADLHGLNYE